MSTERHLKMDGELISNVRDLCKALFSSPIFHDLNRDQLVDCLSSAIPTSSPSTSSMRRRVAAEIVELVWQDRLQDPLAALPTDVATYMLGFFRSLLALRIHLRVNDADVYAMAGQMPCLRALLLFHSSSGERGLTSHGVATLINGLPSLSTLYLDHPIHYQNKFPACRSGLRRHQHEHIFLDLGCTWMKLCNPCWPTSGRICALWPWAGLSLVL